MEISININKKNKSKILSLIDELVEAEEPIEQNKNEARQYKNLVASAITQTPLQPIHLKMIQNFPQDYLSKPNIKESTLGSWYMFNSFFASKAILRVLSSLLKENKNVVYSNELLNAFYSASKQADLLKYRGFPKEREKTRYEGSNISKLRYFILWPLAEMGFITIQDSANKQERIRITRYGLEFGQLENSKLDSNGEDLLSNNEIEYLRAHLKHIDSLGYKEKSILYSLYEYIKSSKTVSHDDIVNWFAKNPIVIDYIYKDSRAEKAKQSKNSERFHEQMEKAARAFASGKIALLRELKVIEDKRGSYRIISPFE